MKSIKLISVFFILFLASCRKENTFLEVSDDVINKRNREMYDLYVGQDANKTYTSFPESFELASNTTYSEKLVTLPSGKWLFSDALLGTSASDKKVGLKSVRLVNTGKISMRFDLTNGISKISVAHAKYGTDAASSWELWLSSDMGLTYHKMGSTIISNSTLLQTQTFDIKMFGNIRLEIRKVSGGTARLNIDNISIDDFTYVENNNMGMGNPTNASVDLNNYNNYLIARSQYCISYNKDQGKPNWVSWYLNKSTIDSVDRSSTFTQDMTIPSTWRITEAMYSNTGFHKGHNCPASDRSSNLDDNKATNIMTNIMPQAPFHNSVSWLGLENYCRTLAKAGNEVYIICGSYGSGGTLTNGTFHTIANGKVTVPASIWKVAVIIPEGSNDLSRVSSTTRVIAINMPNQQNLNSTWHTYRTSVDQIETLANCNLLSNLPIHLQTVLEQKVDDGPTK